MSLLCVAGTAGTAEASHFRGGNVFVTVDGSGNVTVTMDSLWRKTAFNTIGSFQIRSDSNASIVSISSSNSTYTQVWADTTNDSFSIRRERWVFSMSARGLQQNTWYRVYATSCCRIGGIANAPEDSWALTARFKWVSGQTTQTPLLDAAISTTVFKTTNGSTPPDFSQNLGAIDPDQPLSYTFITGAVSPDYGVNFQIGAQGSQAYSATDNTCTQSSPSVPQPGSTAAKQTCMISPSPYNDASWAISVDSSGQIRIPGKTIVSMKDLTYYEPTSPRGDYVFKLRVTDSTGAFSERDILLDVAKSSNNPPAVPSFTGATTVQLGNPITINVSSADPDGNAVTLIASNVPSWMTFTRNIANPGTGVLSGTPTLASQAGTYSINVDARDSGTPQLTSSGAVVVTVNGVNQAPTINFVPNQAVATDPLSGALLLNSGTTLNINVSATDPNPNDTLTLTAFFGTEGTFPPGASFTQTGPSSGVFTWQLSAGANEGVWSPGNAASGKPPLSLRVRDNGNPNLTATQQVTISVGPSANVSPALSIYQANTQIDLEQPVVRVEGQPITFDLVARDSNPPDRLTIAASGNTPLPAGATLTYLPASPGAYPNPVRYQFNWTPAAGQAGTYSIQFFALDTGSPPIDERRTVTFTISAPATPPQILSIAPNQGPAAGGTLVTVNGTGFTGASAVEFGGAAVQYTVASNFQITFTTDAGTAGALKDVRVVTPYGSDTLYAAFQYNDNPDTDGDGIKDCIEGTLDSDLDGRPNLNDLDADGDGIPDSAERLPRAGRPVTAFTCNGITYNLANEDGDSQPDYLDLDSDNDGITDQVEGQADVDQDGVPNYLDLDSDGDGKPDAQDNCPRAPNANQADIDGDGVGDVCDNDTDNDGLPNSQETVVGTDPARADTDSDGLSDGQEVLIYFSNPLVADSDGGGIPDGTEVMNGTNPNNPADDDLCPNDPTKTAPGICGCGVSDADSDGDGTPNCRDACANDPANDADGDGRCADVDNCPTVPNADQRDTDGDRQGDACDADDDGDGVADAQDNCALDSNADQANIDNDSLGDICDPDDDNDGVADGNDNCPYVPNPDQADNDELAAGAPESTPHDHLGDACDEDDDNDGIADVVDNCQFQANQDQADQDGDGQGDVCDADDDNDQVPDVSDNCAMTANPAQEDADNDGVGDACDNCATAANADQSNGDADSLGDVCDNCPAVANQSQADSNQDGTGDACDTTPPAAPTVSLDDVNEANQFAAELTITGERGATIEYSISDGTNTVRGTATMPAGGAYTTNVDVSTLADGSLTISSTVRDGGGNASTAGTTTADKDTVAPTAAVVSLYDVNGLTVGTALFAVQGEVGARIEYTISDGTNTITASDVIPSDGTFEANLDLGLLLDGTLTAQVTLFDALNNESVPAIVTARKDTVDPAAPTVSLGNVNAAGASAVQLTITGEAGTRVSYRIADASNNAITGSGTISTAGTFTASVDVSSLADGAITATARLTDGLGNTGSAGSASVSKDTQAPAVPSLSLANVSLANQGGASLAISGEVGAQVAWSVSDGTASVSGNGTIPAGGTLTLSLDLSELADRQLTATARLTDALGNQSAAGSDTAEKDTVAPVAPVVALANVNLANRGAVAFTVAGEAGATINWTIGSVSGSATMPAGGYSAALDLSSLADGAVNASVTLTDALGNQSTAGTASAQKDTVAPAAPAVALVDVSAANAGTAALTISGEAGASVSWSVSDGASAVSGTDVVPAAGTLLVSVNAGSLADGTLTATARLTDALGNTGLDGQDTAQKDTVAPAAPAVTLANANIAGQGAVALTISGEVGATIAYTISDGSASITGSGTVPASGTYSTTRNLSSLADGTLTLSAQLTDGFGNTGAAGTGTGTKDTVAPVAATLTLGDVNLANRAAASLTIAISGEAGASVSYTLSSNAGLASVTGSGTIPASGTLQTTVDVTSLADGTLTARARVTDVLGNLGAQGTTTARKDTVAPNAPVVTLANASIANVGAVALTVSGEANATVAYSVGGVSGTGTLSSGGSFSTTLDLGSLADGAIAAQVTLTDALGNTSSAGTASALKDTVAPAAPSVRVDDVNLAGSASTPIEIRGEAGAQIAYSLSDASAGTADVTGTATMPSTGVFTATVDVSSLADGAITLTASLTDALGNAGSSASDGAAKDVVIPVAPVVSLADVTPANASAVALTVTGEAGTSVSYTVSNGSAADVTGTGVVGANGTFSTTVDLSSMATTLFAIRASCTLTDAVGNTSASGSAVVTPASLDIQGGTVTGSVENADGSTSISLDMVIGGSTFPFTVTFPAGTTDNGTPITITPGGTTAEPKIQVSNATLPAGMTKAIDMPMTTANKVCITDSASSTFSTVRSLSGSCPGAIVIPGTVGGTRSDNQGHTVIRVSSTMYRVTGLKHTVIESWLDSDGDDWHDSQDSCPGSNMAGPIPSAGLTPGHMGDNATIRGCNATQILGCKPGQNNGERQHGLSPGTQNVFTTKTGWAAACGF